MRFAQTARRHALAGILLGSMALAPASAFAWDQDIVDQFDHFIDCFDLMISDPAAHAAECGPGRAPPAFTHVTGNGHYEAPQKDDEGGLICFPSEFTPLSSEDELPPLICFPEGVPL